MNGWAHSLVYQIEPVLVNVMNTYTVLLGVPYYQLVARTLCWPLIHICTDLKATLSLDEHNKNNIVVSIVETYMFEGNNIV